MHLQSDCSRCDIIGLSSTEPLERSIGRVMAQFKSRSSTGVWFHNATLEADPMQMGSIDQAVLCGLDPDKYQSRGSLILNPIIASIISELSESSPLFIYPKTIL